jgi:hypothetical protein
LQIVATDTPCPYLQSAASAAAACTQRQEGEKRKPGQLEGKLSRSRWRLCRFLDNASTLAAPPHRQVLSGGHRVRHTQSTRNAPGPQKMPSRPTSVLLPRMRWRGHLRARPPKKIMQEIRQELRRLCHLRESCGGGAICEHGGNATCTSCVEHANKATAATACMDCVAGGKYNSVTTGVTACTDCGAGKASEKLGTAVNAETVCVACVAGKHATTASGATTCLDCIAGKYSGVATGVTVCTDCGAGKFSEKTGIQANSASVCVACISGKRGNAANGATSCEIIVAGASNVTTPGFVHLSVSVCLFFLELALCENTLTEYQYLRTITTPSYRFQKHVSRFVCHQAQRSCLGGKCCCCDVYCTFCCSSLSPGSSED